MFPPKELGLKKKRKRKRQFESLLLPVRASSGIDNRCEVPCRMIMNDSTNDFSTRIEKINISMTTLIPHMKPMAFGSVLLAREDPTDSPSGKFEISDGSNDTSERTATSQNDN
jgi:hypothetical protein